MKNINQSKGCKGLRVTPIATFVFVFLTSGGAAWANQQEDSESKIETISVTATKRTESVQTIPSSISAISGDDLAARGMTEFADFAVSIPNLSFGATSDGVLSGRSISIRGIQGLNTTGVYIDDTPITESIDPRILNLERIEVLRGPTGTLYGGRSLGGTIRQITKKADPREFFGRFSVGLSSTKESAGVNHIVTGSLNIPIGEDSAILFSVFNEKKAGVFDRVIGTIADHLSAPATISGEPTLIVEDVDDEKTTALQLALLSHATDEITIDSKIMYQKTKLDGFPLADIEPENFDQNRDFNSPEGGRDEWALFAFNINYEQSYGTWTSASSYFERETFEYEDSASFINFLQALPSEHGGFGLFGVIPVSPVTSQIYQELTYDSLTQEFRFASDFGGVLELVAGVFYQETDDNESFEPRNYATGLNDNFALFAQTLGLGPVEEIWPFGDLIFTAQRPSQIEELGVYGEFTYQVAPDVSFVLGARYFDAKVSFQNTQAGLAAGFPLSPQQSLSTAPTFSGEQSDDGFNFKAAIEYQVNRDLFLFGVVAEGFRIGGANGPVPTSLGCPSVNVSNGYESDELVSYEAGFKADINNYTRLNATAFYIDFDNIQQKIQLGCGFQYFENFGTARSQGVEMELLLQPTPDFSLGLNVGYTDAQFTESVTANDTEGNAVFSVNEGDKLQQVPQWTVALNAQYIVEGAIKHNDLAFRLDANYVGESVSVVNSAPRVRESYQRVNFRVSLENEDYSITLFVDNLTNDIANLSDNRSLAAETPGRPRFVISRPRTMGVKLDYRF